MDFGTLPPEINSGRMYVGAGAGPLLAAAAAWDELSTELRSAAASYRTTLEGLTVASWQGPSSAAMLAAALPYAAWLSATAGDTERAAVAANAAAAAYDAAFAATVPPEVVAANRSLLTTLIATNILGQNTSAIATADAEYAEMWAQDAVAMYTYAGESATASQLTAFSEPPQTTNVSAAAAAPIGSQLQAGLSGLINSVPNVLQSLASTATTSSVALQADIAPALAALAIILGGYTGPFTIFGPPLIPIAWFLTALQMVGTVQGVPGFVTLLNASPRLPYVPGALAPLRAQYIASVIPDIGRGAVSGSLGIGRATLVGSLAVPQGWVQAAPALRSVASVLPGAGGEALTASATEGSASLFGDMALSSVVGRVLAGATAHTVSNAGSATQSSVGEDIAATATIIVVPGD